MKKSLFAIAAITAFAGAAQAQSSVTVYGVLDIGVSAIENTSTQNGVATTSRVSSTGNASNQQTSRIGFRGVEDLGGGTSAEFKYELGLGTFGTSNATTFSNREQWIGLNNKAMGSVRLGYQYTSMHSVFGNGEAGGSNNVVGTLYSGGTSTASTTATYNISGFRPYNTNLDRAITYISPTVSGFTAEVQTAQTNASTSDTSGTTGARETGASLKFTGVKNLSVALGYGQKNTVVPGTSNLKLTNMALTANYNFGVAQVFATAVETKLDSQAATTSNLSTLKGYQLGVRAPITPKIGVWASALTGSVNSDTNAAALATYSLSSTTGAGRSDLSGFQIGSTYNFSKRTNLYAIYGQQSLKGKDLATNDKLSSTQYAVGLRHTF